jgi:hypothetical protein
MSIIQRSPLPKPHTPFTESELHTISGIGLIAQYNIPELTFLNKDPTQHKQLEDQAKLELCQKLAREMFQTDCIEFTKQIDVLSGDHMFRARIFVTPKDTVQLLRVHGKIK